MSNTKLLARMGKFNNSVKPAEMFNRLLTSLCRTHSGAYPWVADIERNIGDHGLLLCIADSLSSQQYEDYKEHFAANQFSLLIRKYPKLKVQSLDPEGLAIAKFMRAEHRCKRVNQRFRCFSKRSPREELLSSMRSFIRYVLGDAPDEHDIFREVGFGPGASIGVHGTTNFARKILAESWSVTPGAFELGYNAIMSHPILPNILFPEKQISGTGEGWSVVSYDLAAAREAFVAKATVVQHNKIVFVAKTAKVHRTIAVEPLLNSYLQKGIDRILRQRLKRIGFDLATQEINQLYAKFGSEDWMKPDGFCTLDLESASDSVSTELVRAVLPPDWFALLNQLRARTGLLNGRSITYEKFCSMGNGFCFPLETLIFVAICHATGAGKPRLDYIVYGDDIIVRKPVVDALVDNLRYCGFTLNVQKTHVSGPFRESCGEDWFAGKAVRPFTLDFEIGSLVDVIKLLNLVQRNDLTRSFFRDIGFITFDVPPDLRFVRPVVGNADAAVTVALDCFMSSPFAKWNTALHAWGWYELCTKPKKDTWFKAHIKGHHALVFAATSGASSETPFAFRRETKTKVRRMAYSTSRIAREWPCVHIQE